MSRIHVFTSAAFNYIPKVRLLFQSLRRHHPEFVLHLALADAPHPEFDLSMEPFDEVMPIAELGIPDWQPWSFCHDIVELATAIKPFALTRLLALPDCSAALYLDPDIVVFSRLDDLLERLQDVDIVLTPHLTAPEATLEAVADNEICALKHGVYNLGFIGVRASAEGQRFAGWWSRRVYHFCRNDIPNGLFTDQRWIDLVPGFFSGVDVLRSSRFNVAAWNLATRQLNGTVPDGLSVDGEPLGFYHFTGFDSGAHSIMSEKNSGGNAVVRELVAWYERETTRVADDRLSSVPWAFGRFTDGTVVHGAQRVAFRDRPELQARYGNPFDTSAEDNYLRWWRRHRPSAGSMSPLSFGYGGGRERPSTRVREHLKRMFREPEYRRGLMQRALAVARKEGIAGLIRRLR